MNIPVLSEFVSFPLRLWTQHVVLNMNHECVMLHSCKFAQTAYVIRNFMITYIRKLDFTK